mgnify:CR=1 FL=1
MKRTLALILLALGMNVQAATLTLNDARAQGRVGETLSGYIAPIAKDAETLALVNRINAARTESVQRVPEAPCANVYSGPGKERQQRRAA